jgi:hypothetical protein
MACPEPVEGPEDVVKVARSYTGKYLGPLLNR